MSDAYFEGLLVMDIKLAGVTFDDRQINIQQCKEFDSLNLIREPDNPYNRLMSLE